MNALKPRPPFDVLVVMDEDHFTPLLRDLGAGGRLILEPRRPAARSGRRLRPSSTVLLSKGDAWRRVPGR